MHHKYSMDAVCKNSNLSYFLVVEIILSRLLLVYVAVVVLIDHAKLKKKFTPTRWPSNKRKRKTGYILRFEKRRVVDRVLPRERNFDVNRRTERH